MVSDGRIEKVTLIGGGKDSDEKKIPLGKTMLGRDWLGVSDKRLSRKQAEIVVEANRVVMIRHGINPVRIVQTPTTKYTMKKDVPYTLNDKDSFTLLGDEYPFTIKIDRIFDDTESTTNLPTDKVEAVGKDVKDNMKALSEPISEKQNNSKLKPDCQYGANCYRQNPEHLDEYNHPPKSKKKSHELEMEPREISGKRTRTEAPSSSSTQSEAAHGIKRPASTPLHRPKHKHANDDDNDRVLSDDVAPPLSPATALASPMKRTKLSSSVDDAVPTTTESTFNAGARSLAVPLFCTLGRQRKTLLEPTQAVKALLNAARPFLRKHHDDTQLNILVLCADVTAAAEIEALDATLGANQLSVRRVADANEAVSLLLHLSSQMKNPCRYIANEATWRLKPGGGIVNKTVFNEAGRHFADKTKELHPLPAHVGTVCAVPLEPTSPLRMREHVHAVLHVVVPILDPDSPDRVNEDEAVKQLQACYTDLFKQFYALALKAEA